MHFKNLPADTSKSLHVKLWIQRTISGYILQDNHFHFKKRIRNADQTPIEIDGEQDFYVDVCLTQNGKQLPLLEKTTNLLPSTLFKFCKQGDLICFELDGKSIIAELDQHAKWKCDDTKLSDEFNFEAILATVKAQIPANMYLFMIDNVIRAKKGSPYYCDAITRHPFFNKMNHLVRGEIVRGTLGANQHRTITLEELQTIPTLKNPDSDKLNYWVAPNHDGTITLTLGVPGHGNPNVVEFVRTKDWLHLFVNSYRSLESEPKYDVLTFTQQECQNEFDIVSLKDGLLTLKSRLPQPVLEEIKESSPFSGFFFHKPSAIHSESRHEATQQALDAMRRDEEFRKGFFQS